MVFPIVPFVFPLLFPMLPAMCIPLCFLGAVITVIVVIIVLILKVTQDGNRGNEYVAMGGEGPQRGSFTPGNAYYPQQQFYPNYGQNAPGFQPQQQFMGSATPLNTLNPMSTPHANVNAPKPMNPPVKL